MTYEYSEKDFDGSKAAPLLIVGEEAKPYLLERQDHLADNFEMLTHAELDPYVKPIGVNFVIHSVKSRMSQREGWNSLSYIKRLHREPLVDTKRLQLEDVEIACDNALVGRGTALQNEIARYAFGMASGELTNLTIIGNARKQLEAPMWDEVSELIGKDAHPRPEQMYRLQVLGFDRAIQTSPHIAAMRIGMKRRIGKTPFGAQVKARTTAIINMSPSTGVSPSLIELFKETAQEHKKIEAIADLPEFKRMVGWLVRSELPPHLVLARNETVYSVGHQRHHLFDSHNL